METYKGPGGAEQKVECQVIPARVQYNVVCRTKTIFTMRRVLVREDVPGRRDSIWFMKAREAAL